jgi:hypothetical protein
VHDHQWPDVTTARTARWRPISRVFAAAKITLADR